MNRRDFITSTVATALTAAFLGRLGVQAVEEKPQTEHAQAEHATGWCVEYILAPQPDIMTTHTAYIPVLTNGD